MKDILKLLIMALLAGGIAVGGVTVLHGKIQEMALKKDINVINSLGGRDAVLKELQGLTDLYGIPEEKIIEVIDEMLPKESTIDNAYDNR